MKKRIVLLMVLLSICSFIKVDGQDKVKLDSLLNVFKQAKHDTTCIKTYLNIGDLFKYKVPDSALFFYQKAVDMADKVLNGQRAILPQIVKVFALFKATSLSKIGSALEIQGSHDKAIDFFLKSLIIYEEFQDKEGISKCYLNIGNVHSDMGNFDKAIDFFFKSLIIAEEMQNKKGIGHCFSSIGHVHYYQGTYDKAIEFYSKSLKIKEELGDKEEMADIYNNIGNVYNGQGIYDKAVEKFLISLKLYEELGNKRRIAICYNNIGIVYDHQYNYDHALKNYQEAVKISEELNDKILTASINTNIGIVYKNLVNYDKSIENYLKALIIFEEFGHKRGISFCYNNIGNVYELQCNYIGALKYYLKASKLFEELGNKDGAVANCGNIAGLYREIADSCKSSGTNDWISHLDSSLYFGHKAYNLAIEIGALDRQKNSSGSLQESYTKLGNYKEALKYAEIFIEITDSMFSEEKTKAIAEMTTKYEAEKKQLQIEKMEQQKELDDKTIEAQNAKNRKQQILIFSAVGGFLIVLVFSMIILRMFRQKRRANVLLATQNDEINQQKEQIEEQNQNITDSIVYAQRIQRALLPPGDYMKQLLPSRFILYKPRDIVSGDFYWVSKKDGLIITAVADCTGHGVPGAMMSMLGVSILNEIVNTMQKLDAGEILNNLRTKIIDSLHQGGNDTQLYDGMDLALCLIDMEKKKVQFAGANCPLCLIRDGELVETKGDKMPIGVHAMMDPFTNHTLKLQEGDLLYTFSDGYIDQFGGENEKRFTQRRFKKLLLDIHDKSMPEQKEELEINLKAWQGNTDQIDDILVMGVRI